MSAEKFDLAELERLHAAASAGDWTAYRMVHHEHGGDLTPEEAGEYAKNSVVKSAGESGSTAFLAILVQKADGPADVCHVGNGPTSPANAASIAALHNAAPALFAAARERDDLETDAIRKADDLDEIFDEARKHDTEGDHVDGVPLAVAVMRMQASALKALAIQRDALVRHVAFAEEERDRARANERLYTANATAGFRDAANRLAEVHAQLAKAEDVIAAAREANSVIADEWGSEGHEELIAALAAYDAAKGGAK